MQLFHSEPGSQRLRCADVRQTQLAQGVAADPEHELHKLIEVDTMMTSLTSTW